MLDSLALSIIYGRLSRHSSLVNEGGLITQEEHHLWLWLIYQCMDNTLEYSFNYEQISMALNKPPKVIHRLLFRLRITGFLQGDIPAWYTEPTAEMIEQMRTIKILPGPSSQEDIKKDGGLFLPKAKRPPILINLIKKFNA